MHNEVGQGVSVGLGEFGDGLIHGSLGVSRVRVPGCIHENLKSLDAINCMSARNSAIGRKICGIPFFLCYCGLYAFARAQNTVTIGFCDHPPSEGLRLLKPARPLKQESGYSDQVVAKTRVWI